MLEKLNVNSEHQVCGSVNTWQRCWGAAQSSGPWSREHHHGFARAGESPHQSCLVEDHDLYLYETSEALLEEVRETDWEKSGFSTLKEEASRGKTCLKICAACEKALSPFRLFSKVSLPLFDCPPTTTQRTSAHCISTWQRSTHTYQRNTHPRIHVISLYLAHIYNFKFHSWISL